MTKFLWSILIMAGLSCGAEATAESAPAPVAPKSVERKVSPSVAGWGNLIVPGLGATFRGEPERGLGEAFLEIGTFYGGTFGARESRYHIDGSIDLSSTSNLYHASTSLTLQQVGLKLHMYDTFYHYQQLTLDQLGPDQSDPSLQPIYRGTWKDTLTAPFKWKNISSVWTYPVLIGVSGYLIYDYAHTPVTRISLKTNAWGNHSYLAYQTMVMPFGSAFGEDVFFRGFLQREFSAWTGSRVAAVAMQASLFSLAHHDRATSFLVGAYFGAMAYHLDGDLEPAMASHFWINVVSGVLSYWTLRRSVGGHVPFDPPLALTTQLPF